MEQTSTQSAIMFAATGIEMLAGVATVIIIIVGGIWAVNGVFLRDLKSDYRIMRTQMDGVHIAINSLTVAVAEMKASMSLLEKGLKEMLGDVAAVRGEIGNDIGLLRGEVDAVNGSVVRITDFLAHLAGTPPSFPSDQRPA
jgi:hypothetical protein